MQQTRIILITGFALFAMFFGAGNIVFPLKLGVSSGQYLPYSVIAFLITGVAMPYFGLYALALYKGDYWKFFKPLSRTLAFAIITFIIMVIGPLFAAPRTAVVTFNTFLPFLPTGLNSPLLFNFFYFAVVYALVAKPNMVIQVIGKYISPVKICTFVALILMALLGSQSMLNTTNSDGMAVIKESLSLGYGTMDLLGAFFYCSVAYFYVKKQCEKIGAKDDKVVLNLMGKACLVGATLTSLIYVGFMVSAHAHAAALENVPTESLVSALSLITLGKLSTFFVCIFVFFASIATASALSEVSADYFHRYLFYQKISRNHCLLLVLAIMYSMAFLGFDGIMRLALPILNYLYPLLILYTFIVLLNKRFNIGEMLPAKPISVSDSDG